VELAAVVWIPAELRTKGIGFKTHVQSYTFRDPFSFRIQRRTGGSLWKRNE
jgi:hypothetical protein